MVKGKITFIGAGNMAEALIRGILGAGGKTEDITATDIKKERLEYIKSKTGVVTLADNRLAIQDAKVVVLSVKPQAIRQVVEEISGVLGEGTLVISIAAGVSIRSLEEGLGEGIKIVRVMPNTPVLVGEGISAISLGQYAGREEEDLVKEIFSSVGKVVVVKEESMDIITAISGSGPAYIFLAIEGLVEAGIQAGLSEEVTLALSTQTVLGAAKMTIETGEAPETLRQKVTSPGGTTEAALRVLSERGWKSSLIAAVRAATARSKELGQ
ncbi:TPA: pyrroline-5-carboxylate reductase [bacterium]|nr:pyrroline-5-carboxylate reductase [bacterium]